MFFFCLHDQDSDSRTVIALLGLMATREREREREKVPFQGVSLVRAALGPE